MSFVHNTTQVGANEWFIHLYLKQYILFEKLALLLNRTVFLTEGCHDLF